MAKTVQIPVELWDRICLYFTAGARAPVMESLIIKGIEEKQAAQKRRSLYQESKHAIDAEHREAARQAYLDEKGVPEGYRW